MEDFLKMSGPAANDLYGKLNAHIHKQLVTFITRLGSDIKASFEMYNIDAQELTGCLGMKKYDRIETANLADDQFLGPALTVDSLSPLLQTHERNPHATLITLHMYTVALLAINSGDFPRQVFDSVDTFLPGIIMLSSTGRAHQSKLHSASLLVVKKTEIFDR